LSRALDWKFWVGLIISAVFLYLALRQVDMERLWFVLRSAAPTSLGLAVFISLLQYPVRTFRWGILLDPIRPTGFGNRLLATLVGFAANCLLPARLGEFIRANYLGFSEDLSSSSVLGTVVVERLFDGLILLAILVMGLAMTRFPAEYTSLAAGFRGAGFFLFSGYLLIILILAGFKWKAQAFLHLLDRIIFFLTKGLRDRITGIVWRFSLGIVLPSSARGWIAALLSTVVVWFLAIVQIKIIAMALDFPLPFTAGFIVLAAASVGVAIPSAPGFIGTFHLAVQYAFMIYGFNPEESLSAAILLHAAFFIPTVIAGAGAFFLLHGGRTRLVSDKYNAE